MLNGKRIGVVVLAYNVERQIGQVLNTIPEFVDLVCVVNDGSHDKTAEIAKAQLNHKVILLNHRLNLGPGAGLFTGYLSNLRNNMDIVVKIDGDGQMDSDKVVTLLHPILLGIVDYTKGERMSLNPSRNGMPRYRMIGNSALTVLTRIACGNYKVSDTQNGFTAISANALRDLLPLGFYRGYGYLNDILVKLNCLGYEVVDVPMQARYGNEKSSVKLHKYIVEMSWLLLKLVLWRKWRAISRRAISK